MSKEIPFTINSKDMTIELSMARKIMPEIEIGAYIQLNKVINPETLDILNLTLEVIPDTVYN